jgi:hypothetical protein
MPRDKVIYLVGVAVIVAVTWFVLVPLTRTTYEGLFYAFLAVGAGALLRMWSLAAVRRRKARSE